MGSMGTNGAHHPLRVVVMDNLRTRSHIFTRLFSQHPELKQIWHPFVMNVFLGPDRIVARMRHPEERQHEVMVDQAPMFVKETYGSQSVLLEKQVAEIERTGKSCWVNEHCAMLMRQDVVFSSLQGHDYSTDELGRNPTYLPDWLFETCSPIMVIRHPVFQVPSFYTGVSAMTLCGPGQEDFDYLTSLRWCRLLYDLLKSQGRPPVVVDGEDVVWRTKEMTTNVCNAIGIDPSGVKDTWETTPSDDRHPNPVIQHFLSTIYNSTGVERPAEKPAIDHQMQKLEERFGKELAGEMKFYIEKNVADYEYLKQFKV